MSPGLTLAPSSARTRATRPAKGATRVISIFMADTTTSPWPFSTSSPSLTRILVTSAGMGGVTSLASPWLPPLRRARRVSASCTSRARPSSQIQVPSGPWAAHTSRRPSSVRTTRRCAPPAATRACQTVSPRVSRASVPGAAVAAVAAAPPPLSPLPAPLSPPRRSPSSSTSASTVSSLSLTTTSCSISRPFLLDPRTVRLPRCVWRRLELALSSWRRRAGQAAPRR